MITKCQVVTKYYGHQIPNTVFTKTKYSQMPRSPNSKYSANIMSPNTKYLANTMVTKTNTDQILWSPNTEYKALWSLNTLKKCAPATRDNRQKSAYITNLLVKLSLSGEIHQY